MKTFHLKIVLLVLLLVAAFPAVAQPPPPDAEPIPIDGGLITLLLSGLALAGKNVFKNKGK